MSFREWLVAACSVSLAISPATVAAQVVVGSGLRVNRPTLSIKDLRDQHVVKQRFDFSCGAAALATLLRFGFGANITEPQLLTDLYGLLSAEEKQVVRDTGFSLLHLQRVARSRGYNAEGFRIAADQLSMLSGPVIVFVEPRGYKHFAVLRGIEGDRVHLADPSRGNVRLSRHVFLHEWLQPDNSGIIFVVEPKTGLPNNNTPLRVPKRERPYIELMTAREMMVIGNVLVR
jgi:uncharacterized protein